MVWAVDVTPSSMRTQQPGPIGSYSSDTSLCLPLCRRIITPGLHSTIISHLIGCHHYSRGGREWDTTSGLVYSTHLHCPIVSRHQPSSASSSCTASCGARHDFVTIIGSNTSPVGATHHLRRLCRNAGFTERQHYAPRPVGGCSRSSVYPLYPWCIASQAAGSPLSDIMGILLPGVRGSSDPGSNYPTHASVCQANYQRGS